MRGTGLDTVFVRAEELNHLPPGAPHCRWVLSEHHEAILDYGSVYSPCVEVTVSTKDHCFSYLSYVMWVPTEEYFYCNALNVYVPSKFLC